MRCECKMRHGAAPFWRPRIPPDAGRLVAVVREGNTLPMPGLSDAGIVVVLPDDVLHPVYA